MEKNILYSVFILFMFTVAFSCSLKTPAKEPETKTYKPVSIELYNEILQIDSILFEALNNKDIETIKSTFSDSLEFYHDNDGLQDYVKTIENFKSLFENKVLADLNRKLVPGSVEVYPIKNYGAVQTGSHTFCHTENGKIDCGTFKFVHVWQKKEGQWKLTRVLSFGHN